MSLVSSRRLAALSFIAAAFFAALSSARAEMYALHLYETPAGIAARTDATTGPAYWASFAAFGERIKAAGVLRGGAAFQTGDAVRTVKVTGGQVATTSGAHVASGELLGGYFVIEVASLDEALHWAAEVPPAYMRAVEVRPYYPVPGMK